MGKPLRVLIVEDSEDDARLLLRELSRGGFEPKCACTPEHNGFFGREVLARLPTRLFTLC